MTWREQLVARLLLLVARMVCDDPTLAQEIKHVSNHIGLYAEKHPPQDEWSESLRG